MITVAEGGIVAAEMVMGDESGVDSRESTVTGAPFPVIVSRKRGNLGDG